MSEQGSMAAAAADLPWEPDSSAEALAASHILVVTVVQLTASTWSSLPSGLLHRELQLRVRLDAVLKGKVRLKPTEVFPVALSQVQEPGGVVSDYQGFWSEQTPLAGASYLLLAADRGDDPARLMQEPAIRAWLPAAQQADVAFAKAAEAMVAPRLKAPASRAAALLELTQATHKARTQLGLLAATYVVARASTGDMSGGPLVSAMLDTVQAPDTAPALRGALATGLCEAALDQDASPAQRAVMARALLRLADIDAASALFEHLAATGLYNLIFEADTPVLKAADVIADKADRSRMAARLKSLDDDRADEIAHWLGR